VTAAAGEGRVVSGLDEALGLGGGAHPVAFFTLRELDADLVDRVIADHLGDDFLDVVPGAFALDPETGRRRWQHAGLQPIAIIGAAETFDLGPTVAEALPSAAVLFLGGEGAAAAVLGWNRCPTHRLVPVASSLSELDVRSH